MFHLSVYLFECLSIVVDSWEDRIRTGIREEGEEDEEGENVWDGVIYLFERSDWEGGWLGG